MIIWLQSNCITSAFRHHGGEAGVSDCDSALARDKSGNNTEASLSAHFTNPSVGDCDFSVDHDESSNGYSEYSVRTQILHIANKNAALPDDSTAVRISNS